MNEVNLIGRLTNTPTLLKTGNNKSVCKFSIAINRIKEGVDYINCIVWENKADNLVKYGYKGMLVGVNGKLTSSSYEKNGMKIYKQEVECSNIEYLSKQDNTQPAQTNYSDQDIIESEEMPF